MFESLSSIGLWGMAVCAVLVFIDPAYKKLWPAEKPLAEEKKPTKDEQALDVVMKSLSALKLAMDSQGEEIAGLKVACDKKFINEALEQHSHKFEDVHRKLELVDARFKAIKPFPDVVKVSVVDVPVQKHPLNVTGSMNIKTDKPIKALVKPVRPRAKQAIFEKVSKQIEGLSR